MSNTHRDLYALFGAEEPRTLPPIPEAAILIASLFQNFGGSLHIDEHAQRRIIIPEPCIFADMGKDLPSLPHAEPHERFHNREQYRGAMKLIVGLLYRLDPQDKAFVYDVFAQVCTPQQAEEARHG